MAATTPSPKTARKDLRAVGARAKEDIAISSFVNSPTIKNGNAIGGFCQK